MLIARRFKPFFSLARSARLVFLPNICLGKYKMVLVVRKIF